MKMKKQFFLSLGAALVLVGCGDDKSALQDVDFPTELQSQAFYSQHLDQAKATNQQCKQVLKTNEKLVGQLFKQQRHEREVEENPKLIIDTIALSHKYYNFLENCANAMAAWLLAEPVFPKTAESNTYQQFNTWWNDNYEKDNFLSEYSNGILLASTEYQVVRMNTILKVRKEEIKFQFDKEMERLKQEYINQQLDHFLQPVEQEWANINWQQGINKLININSDLGWLGWNKRNEFEDQPTLKDLLSAYLAKKDDWMYFDQRKESDYDKKHNKEKRDWLFL
ncbi:hypothetical protein, partial [Lonepinella sp. BR2357]|uniref:hypothetical protein n=1 Tax=Lonepinella sp. BR2357 TaxID=3434549 RepID=UPI003F6DD796